MYRRQSLFGKRQQSPALQPAPVALCHQCAYTASICIHLIFPMERSPQPQALRLMLLSLLIPRCPIRLFTPLHIYITRLPRALFSARRTLRVSFFAMRRPPLNTSEMLYPTTRRPSALFHNTLNNKSIAPLLLAFASLNVGCTLETVCANWFGVGPCLTHLVKSLSATTASPGTPQGRCMGRHHSVRRNSRSVFFPTHPTYGPNLDHM